MAGTGAAGANTSAAGSAGAAVAGSGGTTAAGSGGAALAGSAGNSGASGASGSSGAGDASGAAGAAAGTSGNAAGAGESSTAGATGGSAPASGTFPAVMDTSAKGPFTSVRVNNSGPGSAYTIFHPMQLAPNGALNPIVAWGNGGFTTPADYPLLPHLASHGFVVIASNNTLVTGPEVKSGIDWIIQQNSSTSSPFHEKLDIKKVAGVGYSNGGLATLDNADDMRLTTIVIISGANTNESSRTTNMPKLHTPIAYLCTADDASSGNCAADFAVVKVPAFYGVMKGSVHTSVTTLLGLGDDVIMTRLSGATTAWLRWQLMNDTTLKSFFVGSDCGLCKDTNWTVQPQKGLM